MERRPSKWIEDEFEKEIHSSIEEVLSQNGGFEPPLQRAERQRLQLIQALGECYSELQNGFRVICEVLEARGEAPPQVSEDHYALFDDAEAFTQAVKEGHSMYKLLGFSPEVLRKCYEAATELLEKGKVSEARDGFFFLVTISPKTAPAWTGLGITYARLGAYDNAEAAFLQALELALSLKEAYLGLLFVYRETKQRDKALALCDRGIHHAERAAHELWAHELTTLLINAKNQL